MKESRRRGLMPFFAVLLCAGLLLIESDIALGTGLTAPGTLTARVSGPIQLTLSWSEIRTATSYEIFRSAGMGDHYSVIAVTRATSYKDGNLKPGVKYTYRVRATRGQVSSGFSKTCSVVIRPGVVAGLALEGVSTSRIELSWNPVGGASSYEVYRASGESPVFDRIGAVRTVRYRDNGLTAGTRYSYKVRALNGGGPGGYSAAAICYTKLAAPRRVTASCVGNRVIVAWKSVAGAQAYRISVSRDDGAYMRQTTIPAPLHTYSGTLTDGDYRFKVEALGHAGLGGDGASSDVVSVEPYRVYHAIYDWWAHPLSVNDGACTWVASIAPSGVVQMAKVDMTTRLSSVVSLGTVSPDEHNTPALAFSSTKRSLLAFWTDHNKGRTMWYGSIDRETLVKGPVRTIAWAGVVTYSQVLSFGSRLIVLTRIGDSSWHYRVSPDFGTTWGPEYVFFTGTDQGKLYLAARTWPDDGSKAVIAICGHPVASGFHAIAYVSVRLDTGAVTTAEGTVIGNLYRAGGPALALDQLHPVISPQPTEGVRLLDVYAVHGQPAVAYAIWQGDGPATYCLAEWNGEEWRTTWTGEAGEVFGYIPSVRYQGGVAIGYGDQLYVSAESGGRWTITQVDLDSGATVVLAESTTDPVVRPYVPARRGMVSLLWQELHDYDGYTTYDADIVVHEAEPAA